MFLCSRRRLGFLLEQDGNGGDATASVSDVPQDSEALRAHTDLPVSVDNGPDTEYGHATASEVPDASGQPESGRQRLPSDADSTGAAGYLQRAPPAPDAPLDTGAVMTDEAAHAGYAAKIAGLLPSFSRSSWRRLSGVIPRGDAGEDHPHAPLDPEAERVASYLKVVREVRVSATVERVPHRRVPTLSTPPFPCRAAVLWPPLCLSRPTVSSCARVQGADKGLETWVYRANDKIAALDANLRTSERRKEELEGQVATLNKALHAAEGERDALLVRLREVRTEANVSSGVHTILSTLTATLLAQTATPGMGVCACACVCVPVYVRACIGVCPGSPPAHMLSPRGGPMDWGAVEASVIALLCEVREARDRLALSAGVTHGNGGHMVPTLPLSQFVSMPASHRMHGTGALLGCLPLCVCVCVACVVCVYARARVCVFVCVLTVRVCVLCQP